MVSFIDFGHWHDYYVLEIAGHKILPMWYTADDSDSVCQWYTPMIEAIIV